MVELTGNVAVHVWTSGFLCMYLVLRPLSYCSSSSGKEIVTPGKKNPFTSILIDFKEFYRVRLPQDSLPFY